MRFFNTAGPVRCNEHYCVSPLERFDLEEILYLIDQEKYFALHAPRQTGKTSCLLALMEHLNKSGKYKCLYINVEPAQAAREDVKRGIETILSEMADRAQMYLNDNRPEDIWMNISDKRGHDAMLNGVITRWARASKKPIVLLIDEIDSLVGDTLISVLRQLRAGYDKRPEMFPHSIIMCGVRDVRDYRMHSKEKEIITGGSAFNIKSESLRLGDFSKEEVEYLYQCHTEETGQRFDSDVIDLVWEFTKGQPWLVNALAYEVCFKMKKNRDGSVLITSGMTEQAKENIILRRETHIDQLIDKLKEERVKRVIQPMLSGEDMKDMDIDDIKYLTDLGLICRTKKGPAISNQIYMEVIPRELTYITQENLMPRFDPDWYIRETGKIDMTKLLKEFQEFFRENSEIWIERFSYKEAGAQLLLQAFLQRIANGGGFIDREYGLGRGRTDIFVKWPYKGGVQKEAIELKIRYGALEKTIEKGLKQTREYMDRAGVREGHLVIFDRSKKRTWDEKIFYRQEDYQGFKIDIWGM